MRHQLARGGGFVTTLPTAGLVAGKVMTLFSSKHCHMLVVRGDSKDLEQVAGWVAAGTKVPIDSTFPIRDLGKALERQASGKTQGKVVIDVETGW
jgi:NADPH:quinone reductase-like Zn-dependent oxidoreductase